MSYETIVEMYVAYGKMPRAAEMSVMDDDCWTVAHYLASHNALPAWFNDWLLADADGLTVAHVAATKRVLPKDFPHWKACDGNGSTVFHAACAHGNIPRLTCRSEFDKICCSENKDGKTPYDLYKEHGNKRLEELKNILKSSKR